MDDRQRRSLYGHELVIVLALGLACYDAHVRNGAQLHLHLASVERDRREGTDGLILLNLGDEDVIELSEEEVTATLRTVESRPRWRRIKILAGVSRVVDAMRWDGTVGNVGRKIAKNQRHRVENRHSYWVWGVGVQLADETRVVVLIDKYKRRLGFDHFRTLFDKAAAGAVRFSPEDICPGDEDGELVEELRRIAGLIINRGIPSGDPERGYRDWRGLFTE